MTEILVGWLLLNVAFAIWLEIRALQKRAP